MISKIQLSVGFWYVIARFTSTAFGKKAKQPKGEIMSRKSCIGLLLLLLVVAVSVPALAQPAPRDKVSIRLGGGTVTVEYGRPALKGRSFDALMKDLPEDRMWRAGSDQITTLTTDVPLKLGSQTVPPGKYSVYVSCPVEGPYSLVLNKSLGQPLKNLWAAAPPEVANAPWPHFNYKKEIADQEVARAAMQKGSATATDLLTYTLKPGQTGAVLTLAWGEQSWSVTLSPASPAASRPEGSHRR